MAQIKISINAKAYMIGCDDGQEAYLNSLAKLLDKRVKDVAVKFDNIDEIQTLLMCSLYMLDELSESQKQVSDLARERDTFVARAQTEACQTLQQASEQIEQITARLTQKN